MRSLIAPASAIALAFATGAGAQPSASPTQDDARCLLVMVGLTNATDPDAQRFGAAGVVFFTGRLTAREPNFDFARLKSMAATMDSQSAQTDLQQRCAPLVQRSMQQLQAALAPPADAAPPTSPPGQ
jgi:hypothetical protein